MNNMKKTIKKWLYGNRSQSDGKFSYYGTEVYFPQNSHIFHVAHEEGIYEGNNIKLISSLLKKNSTYIDIGANIGLMSVPILEIDSSCKVFSFEPSPNSLPFLKLTWEKSKYQDRWKVIGKAVGNEVGNSDFFTASMDMGAFDGLEDTGRAGVTTKVTVPSTTLDLEWELMGKPPVSVIKIDVEGSELQVLKGAINCLMQEKPYILLEWNLANIKAYNLSPELLLDTASAIGYQVFSILFHQASDRRYYLPINFLPVLDYTCLKLQMLSTESFLLAPIT